VFEDKDSVKILAELPGVKPEEVKLSLENNVLTIRGEKKQQAEERSTALRNTTDRPPQERGLPGFTADGSV
jgi:HSP20 family molecular chaperone IbpA